MLLQLLQFMEYLFYRWTRRLSFDDEKTALLKEIMYSAKFIGWWPGKFWSAILSRGSTNVLESFIIHKYLCKVCYQNCLKHVRYSLVIVSVLNFYPLFDTNILNDKISSLTL